MNAKLKSIQKFLKEFHDPNLTAELMIEHLDTPTLRSINDYARLMASNRDKLNVTDEDMFSCSMILGYLLKGFVDRYELDNMLNNY